MDSLHKAVRILSELKTLKAQEKDMFEDSSIEDLLGEINNEESLPSEDEIQPQITNDPSDWAAFEKTIDQQEGRSIMEASSNIKLFKMATKLSKMADQWDDHSDPMDDDDYQNKYYGSPNIDKKEIYDSIEKVVAPDNIDLFEGPVEEGDIPNEYNMQQIDLSDGRINQILGIEGTEDDPTPFADDPVTGKRHYDVISDVGLPTNDEEEEKFDESPTEVDDFFQQIEQELAELNAENEEEEGFDEFASELKKFKKIASK